MTRSAGVSFCKNSRSAFASSSQERHTFTVIFLRFIAEHFRLVEALLSLWVPFTPVALLTV